MRVAALFVLVLSTLLLTPPCAKSGPADTVAVAGKDYAITFREAADYVHDHFYDRAYRTKSLAYAFRKAIEDMAVNQLKLKDFFALGLENDSTLLQKNLRMVNEELAIAYYEKKYLDKNIDEAAIRAAYEQSKHEILCRRFVVQIPPNAPPKAAESLTGLARMLETKRTAGAGFDELVAACRTSRLASGARVDTSVVTWQKTLTAQSDSIIFHLPPGQVRMLMSPSALEIVKVVKSRPVPVPPLDMVRGDITRSLRDQAGEKSTLDFDRAKEAAVNERSLKWNTRALESLLPWSNIPRFYQSAYIDTLGREIREGRNPVLLTYNGGKVDLAEYLRLLRDVLALPAAKFTVNDLKKYIVEAVRTDKVVRKARALGLEKAVFDPHTTDPDLKVRIVRIYNDSQVDAKIPPLTEQKLRSFYEAKKDSLYYQLAKVNIYAIISPDKSMIDSLWQLHQAGRAFEKLAPSYYVQGFTRDRDSDTIRSYLSIDPPFLGKAAFALALNQVAGPVEYDDPGKGPQYAIIKCVAVRPAHQLTLDEARKTINDDYTQREKIRLSLATAERLKEKYGLRIYDDVLMRNLPQP